MDTQGRDPLNIVPFLSFYLLQAASDPCGGELCDISLRVTLHGPPATAPFHA